MQASCAGRKTQCATDANFLLTYPETPSNPNSIFPEIWQAGFKIHVAGPICKDDEGNFAKTTKRVGFVPPVGKAYYQARE